MRPLKTILITLSVFVVIFGFGMPDETIKGWFKAGSLPGSYKTGLDNSVFKNGHRSSYIEAMDKNIEGFTTIMQTCSAIKYLGTRVKMTGYIKSANVADWSGMWLRVDPKEGHESLSFDNMQDRPVTGTSDWTKCEIILNVPEESGSLNFGVLISGTGKIWFDNITFEILDNNKPSISKDSDIPSIREKPVNLDFEE